MVDEDDELAGLFAAWREDIDSVPVPAMLQLEATVIPHAPLSCAAPSSPAAP